MSKELTNMSLKELWELFPIVLLPYNSRWSDHFEEMVISLRESLCAFPVSRISHIGSIAIKGIWAKPIIDILIEFDEGSDLVSVADILTNEGFMAMSQSGSRISLNYGYTRNVFAVDRCNQTIC